MHILRPFGIFCVIRQCCDNLVHFSPFWYIYYVKKDLATQVLTRKNEKKIVLGLSKFQQHNVNKMSDSLPTKEILDFYASHYLYGPTYKQTKLGTNLR
jgi:hypothetical protein